MAVVTVDEVFLALKRECDTDEEDLAQMYIDMAVAEIEAFLGRPLEIQEFTENVWADADGAVYLRNTPVVSVTSVTVEGESKPTDYYTVTRYGLENVFHRPYDITVSDIDNIDNSVIYGPQITVTYTAGFPDDKLVRAAKPLVLGAVMKKMVEYDVRNAKRDSDSLGARRIRVEDYEIEYERPNSGSRSTGASNFSMFESEADFTILKRWRRRAIG